MKIKHLWKWHTGFWGICFSFQSIWILPMAFVHQLIWTIGDSQYTCLPGMSSVMSNRQMTKQVENSLKLANKICTLDSGQLKNNISVNLKITFNIWLAETLIMLITSIIVLAITVEMSDNPMRADFRKKRWKKAHCELSWQG
jgi:hypothetical protein